MVNLNQTITPMQVYNRLVCISENKSQPPKEIEEENIVEIVKKHPDVYGYLYLEKDNGTRINGPSIKNGKVWDTFSNVWVSPLYWMRISFPRISKEMQNNKLSIIVETFSFNYHEGISIA